MVCGLQHATRTKDLDPLVEAVDRAARVVDDAKPAAFAAQAGDGGVEIACLANCRINEVRPECADFDNLLAHQPAGEIEIMDRAVAEITARRPDVFDGRRGRDRGW